MRWLGPVVDRDDPFTPFLTAHLPVRVTWLRRTGWVTVLAGFGVALGVVVERAEQVQLAGIAAVEVLLYVGLDLPTRRLHRDSRVSGEYAALHALSTLALAAWTWLLPLADASASGRAATVLGGLLGMPHPADPGLWRMLAWTSFALAVVGGVVLHLLVERLGRRLRSRPRE